MPLTAYNIAAACHSAYMTVHEELGRGPIPVWAFLDEHRKENCLWSVMDRMKHQGGAVEAHNRWVQWMESKGWRGGPKNTMKKTHPNMVQFHELSQEAKMQGYLFQSIVDALVPYAEQVVDEAWLLEEGVA